jgi:hypothetical protein
MNNRLHSNFGELHHASGTLRHDEDAPGRCSHAWAPPGARAQTCASCGATCARDRDGSILSFAGGTGPRTSRAA